MADAGHEAEGNESESESEMKKGSVVHRDGGVVAASENGNSWESGVESYHEGHEARENAKGWACSCGLGLGRDYETECEIERVTASRSESATSRCRRSSWTRTRFQSRRRRRALEREEQG
jgi:hypothetical protein